ncbi:hypothetical protein P875_00034067 [Aspergillus parasiticus SU-1]|uniref:Myb-like DNA-binding domain-containing protein n=1 Tax=Aspergillus parasiticus (strain ATCC 56775 / NRRL 5862 / SRRC 143 / SU-1) TaxID=1403190 RepID=A0A0F0I5T7_ASPPU|nr:hypothetical protein P875_00034067 [Aspergillus parasiticus SU-1]
MAPVTDAEQIEFLLSCVRHANSGKVDFGEVAKECSIVSRGAAAKRYERLLKGRNNAPGAGSSADSPAPSPKKTPTKSSVAKRKTAASKKAAAKKGKAMKVFAVALAEILVKQRTDLAKVEEHFSGEDTEIDEAVLGTDGEDSDEDA